ncbi:MAG: CBS domain-containing protein [Candidatus Schekmanbacteria bacterium]|nr:CBS domain-containing protein [Candidatus Schekmanbacteria bacterium]
MERDFFIHELETIKDTLKKLDKTAGKALFIVDAENKLLGAISDGDIRRHILKGGGLEGNIREIYNRNPVCVLNSACTPEIIKKIFLEKKIAILPVVDENKIIIDLLIWDKFFSKQDFKPISKLNIPVVIMAGGKGVRLDPFTKILPKPLIPIGDKPIIELIISEFRKFGIEDYFLTLNYKAELIESYFNGLEKDYEIKYAREDDYYGTAGSLKLFENSIKGTFILSNCDVIVKANYSEVLKIHAESQAVLTILSSIKHYKIPYGVVNFIQGGKVTNIIEKPEYTFTINTGAYILNSDVLQYIPEKTRFDMTDLIKLLIEQGKQVITYPVNENDYIDIGEWEEYRKVVDKFAW